MTTKDDFEPKWVFDSINLDDFISKYNEYNKDKLGVFYMLYLGIDDKNHLFKLGKSDDFINCIQQLNITHIHLKTGKSPIVQYLIKSPNYETIYTYLKLFVKELGLLVKNNEEDIFKITNEYD